MTRLINEPAVSMDPRAGMTANSVNFFTCMLLSVENKEKLTRLFSRAMKEVRKSTPSLMNFGYSKPGIITMGKV